MTIKGLIFDMDGVLLETENFHYEAWYKAFSTKNIKLSREDYAKYCQAQGRPNAIRNIIGNPTEEDYKILSDIKAKSYKEAIDNNKVEIFHDAKTLLNHLEEHQHIELAIASSSVVADMVMAKTYCAWQFSHTVTGAMIDRNKPYPDIFNMAAAKLDIKKENLAIIEDSIAGVIAARLSGMNVFALNRHGSLDDFDHHRIHDEINDLNLTLTELEENNLAQTKSIPIDDLSEIINYC